MEETPKIPQAPRKKRGAGVEGPDAVALQPKKLKFGEVSNSDSE